MFMPSWRRNSAKNSNSDGGWTGSTTTVTWRPITWVSQNPAHSQPPRCGSTRMTPVPAASAVGDVVRSPRTEKPKSSSSGESWGRRNESVQYRA